MRRLLPFLVVFALVFGGAYAAALISWAMGPWQSVGIEHDGSVTHIAFDQNMPRPEWVPFYPGAVVVQSSRVTSAKIPSGSFALDLATRASFEEVKRFYAERLAAAGFTVTDNGLGPLNPATAALLGIAGSLSGSRAATDDRIDVMIRTPDGLIPSRLLQIQWRKISEFPEPAAGQ